MALGNVSMSASPLPLGKPAAAITFVTDLYRLLDGSSPETMDSAPGARGVDVSSDHGAVIGTENRSAAQDPDRCVGHGPARSSRADDHASAVPHIAPMLSLIGDFSLTAGGQLITVAPSAQRLIAFLALQDNCRARRSYISGSLWKDTSQDRANASLRSALWRSPVLDCGPLVMASNTHVWLRSNLVTDLQRARDRAHELLAASAPDGKSIDVRRELARFADDVLVGWYDDWVDVERERFRQLRLHVLDRIGELLLSAEMYGQSVEVGLVVVASDPLRESTRRLMVRAHLSEGNLAEALQQYRSYACLLDCELGVKPSKAMEDLVAALISDHLTPAWPIAARARHGAEQDSA